MRIIEGYYLFFECLLISWLLPGRKITRSDIQYLTPLRYNGGTNQYPESIVFSKSRDICNFCFNFKILAPQVDLAVLLRGFCFFNLEGHFNLKNREYEKRNLLPVSGRSFPG